MSSLLKQNKEAYRESEGPLMLQKCQKSWQSYTSIMILTGRATKFMHENFKPGLHWGNRATPQLPELNEKSSLE